MSGSWPSKAAYGIWLVDRLGGRELIYRESLGTVPVAAVAAQPIDALVNRGDPKLSRVLTLLGESSPYYATLRACCEKAIRPHPCADKAGTCGRDEKCVCRSCWVRKGGYNHPKKQDR